MERICTFAATQLARPLRSIPTRLTSSPYSREPKKRWQTGDWQSVSVVQVPLAVGPRVQVRHPFPEIRLAPSVGLQQFLSRARPRPHSDVTFAVQIGLFCIGRVSILQPLIKPNLDGLRDGVRWTQPLHSKGADGQLRERVERTATAPS